jgi:hypothetical protein
LLGVTLSDSRTAGSNQARKPQLRSGSLCSMSEKVIFSCAVKTGGKTVSLCASKDVTADRGYIQYRFGRPAKIELEYPASKEGSQKQFRYSHYFRAQVDLTEVSFSSGDFNYTVFDSYNGEEKPAISEEGVTVTPTAGGKDITLNCRGRAKTDFGNLGDIIKEQ